MSPRILLLSLHRWVIRYLVYLCRYLIDYLVDLGRVPMGLFHFLAGLLGLLAG